MLISINTSKTATKRTKLELMDNQCHKVKMKEEVSEVDTTTKTKTVE